MPSTPNYSSQPGMIAGFCDDHLRYNIPELCTACGAAPAKQDSAARFLAPPHATIKVLAKSPSPA
jgi:hypothetical protein